MKRQSILVLAVVLSMLTTAFADLVEFTYTADNGVTAVYQNGSALPLGPGATNWGQADVAILDLDVGTEYEIIWQTKDVTWEGNPGGFLCEIKSSTPLIVNKLLSSAEWEVAFVEDSLDVPDWSMLEWSPATEYGANNDSSTIWYGANWGPVSGIAGEAQWIWTALNFDDLGAPQSGDSVFFRVNVEPVPVPSAVILGSIGLTFSGWLLKRRKML